jgi:hypothetical protein
VIPIAAPGAFGSGSPFGAPYGQPFGGVPSDVLRRAQPKQQRATSMKITLQTQQSGANVGEGLGFSALAFEYMGLGTLKKLGKGATFA